MPDELVFTVQPGVAQRAEQVSLAEVGLRERADLQEWVRKNPSAGSPCNVRIPDTVWGPTQ